MIDVFNGDHILVSLKRKHGLLKEDDWQILVAHLLGCCRDFLFLNNVMVEHQGDNISVFWGVKKR